MPRSNPLIGTTRFEPFVGVETILISGSAGFMSVSSMLH